MSLILNLMSLLWQSLFVIFTNLHYCSSAERSWEMKRIGSDLLMISSVRCLNLYTISANHKLLTWRRDEKCRVIFLSRFPLFHNQICAVENQVTAAAYHPRKKICMPNDHLKSNNLHEIYGVRLSCCVGWVVDDWWLPLITTSATKYLL